MEGARAGYALPGRNNKSRLGWRAIPCSYNARGKHCSVEIGKTRQSMGFKGKTEALRGRHCEVRPWAGEGSEVVCGSRDRQRGELATNSNR